MSRELYRFEPLTDAESIEAALQYVVAMGEVLVDVVLQQGLLIDTVCLFTHDEDEYARVHAWLCKQGQSSNFSHGATTYVTVRREIGDNKIGLLGVRQPDITRPQRGYVDYPTNDYAALLQGAQHNAHTTEITSGLGKSLLELRHPGFDILGFVVAAEDHAVNK